jgi:hypothetical protein
MQRSPSIFLKKEESVFSYSCEPRSVIKIIADKGMYALKRA